MQPKPKRGAEFEVKETGVKVWLEKIRPDGKYCVSLNQKRQIDAEYIIYDASDLRFVFKHKKAAVQKKKYVIPLVSKAQARKLKLYREKRDQHFKDYPVCQFPGCRSRNITLHHGKGRTGNFLTDKRYFKSLCFPHHRYCEENPAEAIKLRLSFKRLENG